MATKPPDPTEPGDRPAGTPEEDGPRRRLKELLSQGEAAARNGQRGEARRLLREALALEPANEHAWLWLAYLAPTPRQSLAYLQQARAYHPHSQRVRQAIAWAQERLAAEGGAASQPLAGTAPPRGRDMALRQTGPASQRAMARPRGAAPPPSPWRARWPVVALALSAVLVAAGMALYTAWAPRPETPLGPPPTSWLIGTPSLDMGTLRDEANAAIARQDWEGVIPALESMRVLAPEDEGVRRQLAVAHLRWGLQLVEQDRLDEAIAHYDAAIRLYANDIDLQTARRLAVGYRNGRAAAAQARWNDAAALLQPVYAAAPDFRDVASLLFTARMQQARAFEQAHNLEAARAAYAQAVAIRPDSAEAQGKLAEIVAILTPPTPTPTPQPRKRIAVDISEQRLRAYENDAIVFDWACSTGIRSMPTRPGEFEILDKIPDAWSNAWGLSMPYWMGIYWAGASENGIHALPILSDGSTLWAGYLGRPVSFGCIVLDTPNAATLYEWAEIGTPVSIAY